MSTPYLRKSEARLLLLEDVEMMHVNDGLEEGRG